MPPPSARLGARRQATYVSSTDTATATSDSGGGTGSTDTTDDQGTDATQATRGAESDSQTTDGQQGAEGTDATDDGGSGDLGDAGKRALQQEREARQTAEQRAREAEQQLAELQRQGMSDAERAVDDARRAGAEAGARMLARAAVVEAATRAGFADADDALVHLAQKADLSGYVDLANERVDRARVAADVAELLQAKPHLAAATAGNGGTGRRGGADHSGTGSARTDLTPAQQWDQQIRAAHRGSQQ